jgi:hypothetical protein
MPSFGKRMKWFIENRPALARNITLLEGRDRHERRLLAIPTRDRLVRVLRYVLDPAEFLSPYGVRSVSRYHLDHPVMLRIDGQDHELKYVPGDSDSGLFGGNSNWRGPVWLPLNFLLIEALERYHHFYGDDLQVECPTGSGQLMTLQGVAHELSRRVVQLFLPGPDGARPCHGRNPLFESDGWRDLVSFHECFDGDTGRGLGASHQTGWSALVVECLRTVCRFREES